MKFLLWALVLVSMVCAQASEWRAHYRMTSSEYQSTFDHYVSLGYRLNSVSGYERNGEANYAAIFEEKDSAAWVSHHGMTPATYQSNFDKYLAQGYRLRQVNGYNIKGKAYYAAIWDKSPASGAWVSRHGLTAESMQSYFNQYLKEGYKLVHISAYEVDGAARFAALWEKVNDGYGWYSWAGLSSAEYQKRFDEYREKGYRLINVDGYSVNGNVYYVGTWDNSPSGAWVARHGMDSPTFQSEFNKYKADGYVLRVLSGYDTSAGDRYAALWIKP